jgi:hypothetical protein
MVEKDLFGPLAEELLSASDPETEEAKRDICAFAEYVMRDQQGKPFKLEPFHRNMLKAMDSERFLLIEAFRGAGKSRLTCVCYPLWRVLQNRDVRILIVTESDKLSKDWLREIENYMLSPQYERLMGSRVVPLGLKENLIWANSEKVIRGRSQAAQGVTLRAVGVAGQIRGWRQDLVLCDDIVSETNSHTPYQRGVLSDWFHAALLPVLDHNPGDPISGQCLVVGTPLYDYDLTSELRREWGDKQIEIGKDGITESPV